MHRSLAFIALLCTLPLLLVSFALSLRSDVYNFAAIPALQQIVSDEQSGRTTTRRGASTSSRNYGLSTFAPVTQTISFIVSATTLTRTSTVVRTGTITAPQPSTFTTSFTNTDTYTFSTQQLTSGRAPNSYDFSRAQYTPPLSYSYVLSCRLSGRCGDLTTATPTGGVVAAHKRKVTPPQMTAAPVIRRTVAPHVGAGASLISRRAAYTYPETRQERLAYYNDILKKLRATTAIFFLKTLSSLALIVAVIVFAVLFRGRHQRAQKRVDDYHNNPTNPMAKNDAVYALSQRTRTLTTFTIVIGVFATTFFLFGLVGFILVAAFFGTGPLPPSYSAEIAFWTLCVVMLIASSVALVLDRRASAQQEREIGNSSGGSFDSANDPSQKKEEPQATSMITQGFDSPQQPQQHHYSETAPAAAAPIQPVSPQMLQTTYSPTHLPVGTMYQAVPDGNGGTVLQPVSQA